MAHGESHAPAINQSYLVNEVIVWRICLSLPMTEGWYIFSERRDFKKGRIIFELSYLNSAQEDQMLSKDTAWEFNQF